MIDMESILLPKCVRTKVHAHSRKRVLEISSDLLGKHRGVSARNLFDALMERERLGSTGLGDGVAIPHCRLDCTQMMAALIILETPVDYEAIDNQPVDILFALVVPREEVNMHLEVLARLAAVFGDETERQRLRDAHTASEVNQRFREAVDRHAAE
jgi:PTS system nitrogen regulatory IIA component